MHCSRFYYSLAFVSSLCGPHKCRRQLREKIKHRVNVVTCYHGHTLFPTQEKWIEWTVFFNDFHYNFPFPFLQESLHSVTLHLCLVYSVIP